MLSVICKAYQVLNKLRGYLYVFLIVSIQLSHAIKLLLCSLWIRCIQRNAFKKTNKQQNLLGLEINPEVLVASELQTWICMADPAPVCATADGWCNTGCWLQNKEEEENRIACVTCTHVSKMLIICSLKYCKVLCICNWDSSVCIIKVLMHAFGEGEKAGQKLHTFSCTQSDLQCYSVVHSGCFSKLKELDARGGKSRVT